MGGEEAKEGIEERRFTGKIFEPELCSLCEHSIKTRRGPNVEEFQAIKFPHHTQYFRDVKLLMRTRPVEGQRHRSDEVDIVDRIF